LRGAALGTAPEGHHVAARLGIHATLATRTIYADLSVVEEPQFIAQLTFPSIWGKEQLMTLQLPLTALFSLRVDDSILTAIKLAKQLNPAFVVFPTPDTGQINFAQPAQTIVPCAAYPQRDNYSNPNDNE
jgi:hypothetical protein